MFWKFVRTNVDLAFVLVCMLVTNGVNHGAMATGLKFVCGQGGAIYSHHGTVTATGCTFENHHTACFSFISFVCLRVSSIYIAFPSSCIRKLSYLLVDVSA